MKVVLIRPPKIQGALERSMVQHPVTILYLAAVLREYGKDFQPEIWDFEVEKFSEKIVRERIRQSKPQLAGITSMTCNIKISNQISGWIKQENPETLTVIGGPHSSAIPEQTLREFPNFDLAAVGEGEQTFLELSELVKSKKKTGGSAGHRLPKCRRSDQSAGPGPDSEPGLASQPGPGPD